MIGARTEVESPLGEHLVDVDMREKVGEGAGY